MPRRLPLVRKLPAHLGDGVILIGLANVAVFLICFVAFFGVRSKAFVGLYFDWLALSVPAVLSGRVWTLLTYGFLHDMDALSHILFNLLGLYFLGPQVERHFGRRVFLRFWLATIAGGGVLAFLAALVSGNTGVTIGASAGTVALIGAWSWLYPNQKLLLLFLIPVQSRWLVYIAVGIDIVFGLTGSDVAIWAHFGGVITAWLWIHGWLKPGGWRRRLTVWQLRWRRHKLHKRRRRFRVIDGGGDDDEPMIH